jgi:hypothetical protein
VSGITIATILFAALVLLAFLGKDSPIGPVAAVMIGAVVCCAACVAGDNLQDLKAGYLVGATPWRQQVMLAIGSVSCALIMAPTLNMLAHSYGIGRDAEHPLSLEARRRISWRRWPRAVRRPPALEHDRDRRGDRRRVIVFDQYLKANGAVPRAGPGAAIGIYLPLETMVPIFLGGLLNYLVTRTFGKGLSDEEDREAQSQGHAVRAGLITGEALMGIIIGVPSTSATIPSARVAGRHAARRRAGEWLASLLGAVGYWMYSRRQAQATRSGIPFWNIGETAALHVDVRHVPTGHAPIRAKLIVCFARVYLIWGSTYCVRASACTSCRRSCSAASASSARDPARLTALALGRQFPLDATEWRHLFDRRVGSVLIPNGCTNWAMQYVASNQTAILNASAALWIALFATRGRRAHALDRRTLIGLVIGFAAPCSSSGRAAVATAATSACSC